MAERIEKIDSSGMRVLSEFPVKYENDEELTIPHEAEKATILIGALDENIIIAYSSKKTGNIISEIVFERNNIFSVGQSISEILEKREPWNEPFKYESGKDNILVTYSSSWAHNLPAPLERVNVYNRRNYELDGLRARDMWLSLPPKMARKLADEIKIRLANKRETADISADN